MNNPIYPLGYKVNHFRQARRLALATSQAAGPLWEFRWGSSLGHLCFVNRVTLKAVQIANATAEELRFNLKFARTFTVADTTNVTSILRANDLQKLNGDYSDSVLSNFVESNAATAASGGTLTQDTDPLASGNYVTIATASTTFDGASDILFDFCPLQEGSQALRFEQNEGWAINIEATKGATQGFVLIMETSWSEALKPQ